jgi:hypothetical protein
MDMKILGKPLNIHFTPGMSEVVERKPLSVHHYSSSLRKEAKHFFLLYRKQARQIQGSMLGMETESLSSMTPKPP